MNKPNPEPKPEPIDNTELVEQFRAEGGRIYHALPYHSGRRGVTFAFKVKGGRVEFATAVQHRNDTFTKKIGTKTAIEHFHAGKTVFLPLGKLLSVPNIFDNIVRIGSR